jgi:hypothetical protein
MGCVSTKAKQPSLLVRQTQQIESLQSTNEELRRIVEALLDENEKLRVNQVGPAVQQRVANLEDKIKQLEEKLLENSRGPEDTFSRGTEEDPPEILLTSNLYEIPQSEPRSSHSILEDPVIKELLDRKRRHFFGGKGKEEGIPPTMASTSKTNNRPS